MRRTALLIVALIGGFTAGCGTEPPNAPTPAVLLTSAPSLPRAGITAPVATVGSGQDIRTPELAARVTVAETLVAADQYAVTVTVRVLRGTYEFGPSRLRLRHASGADTTPIAGGAVPPVAFTLHTGVVQSWRVPFAHAATGSTQILLTDPAGTVLAAWTTR